MEEERGDGDGLLVGLARWHRMREGLVAGDLFLGLVRC